MPELPEVETVCRGLKEQILRDKIIKMKLLSPKIRNTTPVDIVRVFKNKKIHAIERRAKYILIYTDKDILLSHLGMTGNWRIENASKKRKHDHVLIELESGRQLIYNDPRRFGIFDYTQSEQDSPWLNHLGPEPLDKKSFHGEYLYEKAKKSSAPIKSLIMNQKIVVGVGNIYACEALYACGVKPQKPSKCLSKTQANALVQEIQKVLRQAIKKGGSTIRDFKSAGGSEGYFQMSFKVYGRENQSCRECEAPIKNKIIAGRSSFYCPHCQK